MKFGIFYELSVPRPWERESERKVYMNALEQVRLADELGFDQVWAVEHHFLEEYSHCSSPEIFLTACAVQTKRIRVGHGIVVCVPQINHPVRIAERAATLDIISGGRLEMGTGRSATWTELGAFARTPTTRKRPGMKSCAVCRRCGRRSASAMRAPPSGCHLARSFRGRTRSRTRRCGWPSPARAPRLTARTAGSAGLDSPLAGSRNRRSASPSTDGGSRYASRSVRSSTSRSTPSISSTATRTMPPAWQRDAGFRARSAPWPTSYF